ncbi:hypothetical protein [Chelatococcus reniformis]|uniref:hypothetical protein n=1 Tax=Chelatococcus reniformis TaxID=1494448 RepID=UPI00166C24F9|nr:hypothetical protein [Chelatococcus reniformis]
MALDQVERSKTSSDLILLFRLQPPGALHRLTACPLSDGRLQWWETNGADRRAGTHDELVGCSMARNLNDKTYTVVWLALSLDPIDRTHAST